MNVYSRNFHFARNSIDIVECEFITSSISRANKLKFMYLETV